MVKRIVLLLLGSQIVFVRPHSQRINIVQTHLAILKCVEVIKKILPFASTALAGDLSWFLDSMVKITLREQKIQSLQRGFHQCREGNNLMLAFWALNNFFYMTLTYPED